jgi:hypothetical protein
MKNLVYESEKGYLISGNLFARVNLSFVSRKRFWHLTFSRRQGLYGFLLGYFCMHSSRYWPTFQMCLRHKGAVNPFETSHSIFYITRRSIPEIIHVMKMSWVLFFCTLLTFVTQWWRGTNVTKWMWNKKSQFWVIYICTYFIIYLYKVYRTNMFMYSLVLQASLIF